MTINHVLIIFLVICNYSYGQDPAFVNQHQKSINKSELKVETLLNGLNVSRELPGFVMERTKGMSKIGVQFDSGVLPYRKKNKWGFVDKSNKIITHPQYDSLFCGGLNIAIGVVNKTGHFIIGNQGEKVNEITYKEAKLKKLDSEMPYIELTSISDSLSYAFYSKAQSKVVFTSNFRELENYYASVKKLEFDKKVENEHVEIIYFNPVESPPPERTIEYVESDCYIIKDSINSTCVFLMNAIKKTHSDCYEQYHILSKGIGLVHLFTNGIGVVYDQNMDDLYQYKDYENFVSSHQSTQEYLHLKTLKKSGWFNGFYNIRTNKKVTSKYRYLSFVPSSNAFFVITKKFKLGYVRLDGTELF